MPLSRFANPFADCSAYGSFVLSPVDIISPETHIAMTSVAEDA